MGPLNHLMKKHSKVSDDGELASMLCCTRLSHHILMQLEYHSSRFVKMFNMFISEVIMANFPQDSNCLKTINSVLLHIVTKIFSAP